MSSADSRVIGCEVLTDSREKTEHNVSISCDGSNGICRRYLRGRGFVGLDERKRKRKQKRALEGLWPMLLFWREGIQREKERSLKYAGTFIVFFSLLLVK